MFDSIDQCETLRLTAELIAKPSVTPNDAGCQAQLAAVLADAGFTVHHLKFGDTDNLYATHGKGAPCIALVGHTDVVPSGPVEQWRSPPFDPSLRDGMLFGRGAADMKSGVAAATHALRDFAGKFPNHPGTIALLLTSDEEGPAKHGIVKVIEWLQQRGEKLDYALIGEPSSNAHLGDQIRVGRRGSMHVEIRVIGVQGHVAYPEKAQNPIHLAAPLLAALAQFQFDTGNAHFPPTSMQMYDIQSGAGANNVIPGDLRLMLNFRFGTASTEQSLLTQIGQLCAENAVEVEIKHRVASHPFLTDTRILIEATKASIRTHLGIVSQEDTGGGTSDGRFIRPTGAEVVEFGPINETIHKIDECIDARAPGQLKAIYQTVLEKVLLP